MIFKIISQIIFVLFIGMLQIAFISGLPVFFSEIDLIAISLVFILMFFDLKKALLFAAGFGFLLDFYTFYFFGANALVLLGAVLAADFLLKNFFTNRSLYSFFAITALMVFFGRFVYYLLIITIDFIGGKAFLNPYNALALRDILYSLGLDFTLVALALYIFGLFSSRFKPVFLNKKKYG